MYKLEKISIDAGKNSAVDPGRKTLGENLNVLIPSETHPISINSLKHIVIGVQVLVTRGFEWHRTSPIKEIIERGEDYVVFHTNTSIYRLEEIKEE